MRQRKIKDIEERLKAFQQYIIKELPLDALTTFPSDNPLFLELGCGKGRFLSSMAKLNPERNYIGVEGNESVALRVLEKLERDEITNVLIIPQVMKDPVSWFQKSSISGIYLNFPDPWPKDRHEKRRLTSPFFLKGFYQILLEKGFIELKTDNDSLFDYSVKTLPQYGFKIAEAALDMEKSCCIDNNIPTEYENKFKEKGLKIHYLKGERD